MKNLLKFNLKQKVEEWKNIETNVLLPSKQFTVNIDAYTSLIKAVEEAHAFIKLGEDAFRMHERKLKAHKWLRKWGFIDE